MPAMKPPSSTSEQAQPEGQEATTTEMRPRNVNVGGIAWSLGLALVLGILGTLLAEFGVRADYMGDPVRCGLGNPPCSSFPISTHPAEEILHPFVIIGAILIGCSALCLLLCLAAWRRGRSGKVGWFGD